MADDLEKLLCDVVASGLGVATTEVEAMRSADGFELRAKGKSPGSSPKHAWRRRRRTLRQLEEIGRMHHVSVSLVVEVDDAFSRLESSMRELLRARVDPSIEHLALAVIAGDQATVRISVDARSRSWAVPKLENAEDLARGFLKLSGFSLRDFRVLGTEDWPSDLAILRAVKVLQPVSAAQTADYLQKQSFLLPHEGWIATQLDRLRHRGMLTHTGGGRVALSAIGVATLPGTPGKNTSDVHRALTLGRRKW